MANGIAEIRESIPFSVRVANMSKHNRVLVKGQILGIAVPAPDATLFVDLSYSQKSQACSSIKEVPSDGPPEKPERGPPSVKEGVGLGALLGEESKRGVFERTSAGTSCVDEIDLGHLKPTVQKRVCSMLAAFSDMWQGQLGTIKVTEHRIEVKEDSVAVHCQPHRAGPKSRKLQQEEVDTMLQQDVIEPASSEWASPVVIVPKSDGSWRFCVDYRKLNSITVKDSYPLPRMDECIDSLSDA